MVFRKYFLYGNHLFLYATLNKNLLYLLVDNASQSERIRFNAYITGGRTKELRSPLVG